MTPHIAFDLIDAVLIGRPLDFRHEHWIPADQAIIYENAAHGGGRGGPQALTSGRSDGGFGAPIRPRYR